MSKLNETDVQYVAKLSNLKLSSSQIKKFLPQLSSIVDFIGQLSEVPTENIMPTSQTTGLTNVYRKDEVNTENGLRRNQALSGTDNTHNGLFKVPAILEGRTDK